MFSKRDIAEIDTEYFSVLSTNAFQVTIKSNCTGHEWHILSRQDQVHGRTIHTCIIYHRHNRRVGFHLHGQASNLAEAIQKIKNHDNLYL